MSWLYYLLEANLYLGVFYLFYCLLLNRETHYSLSRAFLLFGCVASFILPLTQASILKPRQAAIELLQPVALKLQTTRSITLEDVVITTYILGLLIAAAVLLQRLAKLRMLTRGNGIAKGKDCNLIQLNGDNTAFSFFNYLFIGTAVTDPETIIAHELVHIRQRHSADILFVEVLKAFNWFNPFVYFIQRSLKSLHEYIADEQTVAHGYDALAYSSFLLHNAYGLQGEPVANSFFNYNLLKKRIIMLNKKRSGSLARLKYLAVLPLCGGMLCASTLVFSKDYAVLDVMTGKGITAAGKPKHFKVTYEGITSITDMFTYNANGRLMVCRSETVTPADISYLNSLPGLKVELVDYVKNGNKLQADHEMVIVKGRDTIPPPPPPAPPVKANGTKAPKAVEEIKIAEPDRRPPPPPPAPPVKANGTKAPKAVQESEIAEPVKRPPPPPPAPPRKKAKAAKEVRIDPPEVKKPSAVKEITIEAPKVKESKAVKPDKASAATVTNSNSGLTKLTLAKVFRKKHR